MTINIPPTDTDTDTPVAQQEWCDHCAVDDDPATEPGMPQTVISSTTSADLFAPWLDRTVYVLACGHTVAVLDQTPGVLAVMTKLG